MKRENSLGSSNSLSFSFESQLEERNAETDDETMDNINFNKYEKIGLLKDSVEIKESICTKHYDEKGNKYYNDYKFVSFLGSGAFSKIELVEKEGKKYAMKIIDKSFLQSQKNIEFDEEGNIIVNTSFENAIKEIAILKKTNHPNIIKLYEILYCKKNKKIYLILEYCENGDLIEYDDEAGKFILNKHVKEKKKKIENETYYKTKEILRFLKDIISGLCYLHSNGIIHRDIKPNNILLDKNNVCKITDFNVSSILENIDDDNIGRKICSADHFRPPEGCELLNKDENENEIDNIKKPDLKGKPIDIWALGVTAYILSYNKFPFESKTNNILELYSKIAKAEFEFPKYPKRKKKLKLFITKCLEKDPNKRITAEGLSHFPFLEKHKKENILKWLGFPKINVSKNEIINCINFFVPNCCAIMKKTGKNKEKKIDIKTFKYKKYKGKIHHLNKMNFFNSVEDKYGVFVVEGLIFRKEDFGIPSYDIYDKHNKILKRKYFEHYKKYKLENENESDEKLKRNTFKKYIKNIK